MAPVGNMVRIVRHDVEDAGWVLARCAPDSRLGPQVLGYTGYRETRGPVVRRREVATTVVPVVINFGPAFRLLDRDIGGAGGNLHGSFVAGLHDSWTLVESTGRSHCLQIDFTPAGASRFLGLPIAELAGRVVDLDEILGREIALVCDQLQELTDWGTRFRVVDDYIAARMSHPQTEVALADRVWSRLTDEPGATAIGAIADDLGFSHKHLIGRFRSAFGMTPKAVARLLRFERATGLIESGAPPLAEIAIACGYYDQAHFHRDFRQFAGCTPSTFRDRLVSEGGVVEPCAHG